MEKTGSKSTDGYNCYMEGSSGNKIFVIFCKDLKEAKLWVACESRRLDVGQQYYYEEIK